MTRHTILFLAADPQGTDPRAFGQEARSIQAELERSDCRDSFAFETQWAVRPLDVLHELRRVKPKVEMTRSPDQLVAGANTNGTSHSI